MISGGRGGCAGACWYIWVVDKWKVVVVVQELVGYLRVVDKWMVVVVKGLVEY